MKGEMSNAFNDQILAEKLAKLNNSQQSIETLSHWCIFHRKKAKQVVQTWDKQFNISSKEQKVSFLYLANDILQNSKRKGSEFINEFWKVLPASLKHVYENEQENGKKVVLRLIEIWDERKVFGSRGRALKDDILGDALPPVVETNGKSSNPIKVVKKDSNTIRIKLAVGGMPEKIVTAYQSVLDDHFNEDTALNKCKNSVSLLEKMEKDVNDACMHGNQQGSLLIIDLQEQESNLRQCVQQLESVEATRIALVDQLKEALKEQELKLEFVRTQLHVSKAQSQHASQMRERLISVSNGLSPNPNITNLSSDMTPLGEANPPSSRPITPQFQSQPVTSFASTLSSAEEEHKKAAADVAARLVASSSSAQVLTSILSSLVADEAASMNGGRTSGVFSASAPLFPVDKRPRLEKPMSMSDVSASSYFGQVQQSQQQMSLPQTSALSMQPLSQSNQAPSPFPPPPPPLPPVLPPSVQQQYGQTSGVMVGTGPYGYSANTLPPPPPLPSHVSAGLTRPSAPPPLPPHPPPQQQQQLQSAASGFYQPPGMGFYGQAQSAPPVQRQ